VKRRRGLGLISVLTLILVFVTFAPGASVIGHTIGAVGAVVGVTTIGVREYRIRTGRRRT
jgi:hypothetical protein